jgi:hypothetical protein
MSTLLEGFKMSNFEIKTKKLSYVFTSEEMELIYDALNDYPQWNDDEDDNPTSRIMNKLYNLLEAQA